jgi:hypothetical protein
VTEEYFGRDRLFPRSRYLTRLAHGRFNLFAARALRLINFINRAGDLGNGNDADDAHFRALAPRQLDRIIERGARFGCGVNDYKYPLKHGRLLSAAMHL